MRNFAKLFTVVAALFAFGCTTDVTEDVGVQLGDKGTTTVTLSLEESRTQLGEKADGLYSLYWSEGDKIAINGVASAAAEIAAENKACATFTFSESVVRPFNIIYPAPAEGVAAVTEGCVPVTFLSTQSYKEGTFCDYAAPMYGYAAAPAEGEVAIPIQLNHLTGVLCIAPMGEGVTLTSIAVRAENGSISGTFDLNCSTGKLTAQEGATNQVTMEFDGGLALGAEATPIYITVPAGNYGTFAVTLYTATDKMTVKFDSNKKELVAGKVREFAPFLYQANENDSEVLLIETKEDLIRFAAIASTFYPRKKAQLAGQIDMTGYDWQPIKGFNYEFDGDKDNGYFIKGLSAPLFCETSGTIKNLKLVDVDQKWETPYTEVLNHAGTIVCDLMAGSLLNCEASGKVVINNTTYSSSAWKAFRDLNFGGLVGFAPGATITNCVSDVDITVKSLCAADIADTQTYQLCVGGVIGFINGEAGAKISHVTNKGDISWEVTNTDNSNSSSNTVYVCGVLGRTYAANDLAIFEHITNEGNITAIEGNTRRKDLCVHGIVGQILATPTSCDYLVNKGDITVYGSGRGCSVSGITYYMGSPYSNCHNEGDITIKSTGTTQFNIAGLICIANGPGVKADNYNTGNITLMGDTAGVGDCQVAGLVCSVQYSDATSGTGSYEDCYNSGQINIGAVTVTGGRLYVAGTFARLFFGDAIRCENKAEGAVSISPKSVAEEIVAGGIVGYLGTTNTIADQSVNLTDCTNYAPISVTPEKCVGVFLAGGVGHNYSALASNVTTLTRVNNRGAVTAGGADWGATKDDQCVGGVMGFLYNHTNFSDCHNHSEIKVNPTDTIENCFSGGLIAYFYQKTAERTIKIDKCSNKGKITYAPKVLTNYAWFGGLIGRTKGATTVFDIDDSYNDAAIEVGGDYLHRPMIGSFIGMFQPKCATIDNCYSNEHNVSINTTKFGATMYLGWIAHYEHLTKSMKSTVTNCSNAADVTISEGTTLGGSLYGCNFIGRNKYGDTYTYSPTEFNNCTVSGSFTFLGTAKSTFYYGAFFGYPYGSGNNYTLHNCTTSGDVTIKGSLCNTTHISAGFAGYSSANISGTNFKNTGNILIDAELNGTESTYLAVGGIYATMNNNKINMDGVINTGNITITGKATGNVLVGGFYGYNMQAYTVKNGVNTGTITIGTDKKTFSGNRSLRLGGISGLNNGAATSCTAVRNLGDIIAQNITFVDSENTNIGGLVGQSAANISDSEVYCTVSSCFYDKTGMAIGNGRTDNIIVKNCKIGGKISTGYNAADESVMLENITTDNFFNYIYGGTTDWSGVEGYDGCSFLATKPSSTLTE